MALVCNECDLVGRKPKKIWCRITGGPCMHVRYCAVSMKYYQTDEAARCKARKQNEKRQND